MSSGIFNAACARTSAALDHGYLITGYFTIYTCVPKKNRIGSKKTIARYYESAKNWPHFFRAIRGNDGCFATAHMLKLPLPPPVWIG